MKSSVDGPVKDTTMETNGFMTIAGSDHGRPFVEAYGLLLAGVLLGGSEKAPGVVAVAAAKRGTGVSTTAINLSMMMARTGRPTAIVDANFRNPELHKAFGLAPSPGLADVLNGRAELKHAALPTRIPNLSLLPAGEMDGSAQGVLLSQPGLGELFNIMRTRFDLIVVDTPPILTYPDALYVSKAAGAVLLVVSPQEASRRDQQETRRLLDRVEARILGTVLNRVPSRDRSPSATAP
jgi:capsular exopolysaccharide synthesis family protein